MNLAIRHLVNQQKGCCNLLKLNRYSISQWLKTFDTVLFDADGVLWKHESIIEGAADTFNAMRAMGKRSYVVTNNSANTRKSLCKKAQKMGMLIAEEEIMNSALALANYLQEKKFTKKVYIVGQEGIASELKAAGIEYVPLDEDMPLQSPQNMLHYVKTMHIDEQVGAVVVGLDLHLNVPKISKAASYLLDPKVKFLATNRDLAFPVAHGRFIPGAGVMVATIRMVTKRSPITCGKPNPNMCAPLLRKGIIKPERTLMVGDTLSTDIQFGYNCGFQTLLVGTGVNSLEDVKKAQSSPLPQMYQQVPDLYLPSMFKQTCTHLAKIPKQRVRQWLNGIESIICDADGVLWQFDKAIDGAAETFNLMRSTGRQMFVVTNNSALMSEDLVKKANSLGIQVEPHEMLTSALAITHFLEEKKFKKKVYIVGEQGIGDEMSKAGICSLQDGKMTVDKPLKQYAEEMEVDEDVGAIVVAKDDDFCVPKIIKACTYLQDPKVLFLATCLDGAYPIGNRRLIIGASAMVAAVKAISGRNPLVLGKPNPWMVEKPLKCGAIKPETTLMIGDTLYTDIIFGNNCGFHTLFVGTGVMSLKDVQKVRDSGDKKKLNQVPDTYLPALSALQEFLC